MPYATILPFAPVFISWGNEMPPSLLHLLLCFVDLLLSFLALGLCFMLQCASTSLDLLADDPNNWPPWATTGSCCLTCYTTVNTNFQEALSSTFSKKCSTTLSAFSPYLLWMWPTRHELCRRWHLKHPKAMFAWSDLEKTHMALLQLWPSHHFIRAMFNKPLALHYHIWCHVKLQPTTC